MVHKEEREVELTGPLKMFSYCMKQMLLETTRQLYGLGCMELQPDRIPRVEGIKKYEESFLKMENMAERSYGLQLTRKFYKQHRCWVAGCTESFQSFLQYDGELHSQPESDIATAEIIADGGYRMAQKGMAGQVANKVLHPKLDALWNLCIQLKTVLHLQGLVFADNISLACEIADLLGSSNMRASVLLGSYQKCHNVQRAVVESFLAHRLDFIVCSHLLDNPEILPDLKAPAVVSYTPPRSCRALKTRLNRACNPLVAYAYFIISLGSTDCAFYRLRDRFEAEEIALAMSLPAMKTQLELFE